MSAWYIVHNLIFPVEHLDTIWTMNAWNRNSKCLPHGQWAFKRMCRKLMSGLKLSHACSWWLVLCMPLVLTLCFEWDPEVTDRWVCGLYLGSVFISWAPCKACGCSLSFQPFPESNRWRTQAPPVCHGWFPPCLWRKEWCLQALCSPADKEMNSDRKYFRSIDKHTRLGSWGLTFLLPHILYPHMLAHSAHLLNPALHLGYETLVTCPMAGYVEGK